VTTVLDAPWLPVAARLRYTPQELPRWTGQHITATRCPQCHQHSLCVRGSLIYCDRTVRLWGGSCGWSVSARDAQGRMINAAGAGLVLPVGTIVRVRLKIPGAARYGRKLWKVIKVQEQADGTYRMLLTIAPRHTQRRWCSIEELVVWNYA